MRDYTYGTSHRYDLYDSLRCEDGELHTVDVIYRSSSRPRDRALRLKCFYIFSHTAILLSTMTARPRPLTPLRDRRVTSNSGTDPVKSHILRESGLGWNSSPPMASSSTTPVISPLRIAKRDSASPPKQPHQQHPSQIARRSSSSYKRLTNTNLVSKSPFKAAAAAAATPDPQPILRKVSGEKRPRPPSMHDQAETENDRPFAYKRERRQSKGFQGLVVKEPVTRSPFRFDSALPAAVQTPHRTPSPAPQRSSLVSKRLHGPRLSNDATTGRRHRRRKTVTFDEECDVVEFEAESEGESEEGREGKEIGRAHV